LLETLSQQDEHAEDDELGLNSSGALCIQTISQTVEAAIIPVVMPFVNQNITNQDWRLRDAAIVAFSCILDGPDTDAVGQFVAQSIPVLLGTFNDPNETVRQSAVHCLSTICKLHATAIQTNQVHGILEALLLKLQESPRVATYACSAIYNIARSLRSSAGEPTNLLSTPMLPLLQALFQVNDRDDASENNLRRTSLEAAGEIIASSAMDVQHVLRELLPTIIDRVESALKMSVVSADDHDQKAQLLGLLCIIYQALFRRLEQSDVAPLADRIMASLLQILQIPNAVCHDEAFMATGALADVVEDEFAVRCELY
jgi:importin subunit beta-1